ncbi:MAG: type II toxin-antitoxin system mRNA interferase toxin, RelE/StbE family [Roseofilum sp. SBFL]|nr:type II toxin-antitoxin system mRNA interferase toxin, RelE/StbE family [Roseofilum sp. Belize Diploria]MBP0012688.1 type II toxin-antitoxin system mRNA interferase toxin, RelE/StbE family [Roseofilum sp. SID3]MBP0026345.1 type II toxin-antitoxin system mRNA interferase toxin, RelE/StbE family [Roseofilum sp. SID2]MBP0032989.1 type II toxin-antitoxin system mRNA interferase toxin, RelE/StbE family [Roseofilum sp. Belize BBD 4]MBP0039998.1 type II toxin-antitoxin system mRNA interferase toxin
MMEIVWSSSFKRVFKKLAKKQPQLQAKAIEVLKIIATDPFTPSLKSHKLTVSLNGLSSCSVAYDCRIIFAISDEEDGDEEVIFLIDIGSHDEVY